MPLFKNKKEERKSKIYMPVKKSQAVVVKKRKGTPSFFKKKKTNQQRRKGFNLVPLFRIILVVVITLAIFYLSALYVIKSRGDSSLDDYEKEFVVGIEDIPTYPLSEFIFKGNVEQPSVANFISNGNSAYRLPNGKSIDDVYEYYSTELPPLGWSHTLSVKVGSEEMESGEYWIKEERGLRIYSKFNDVWYELLSVTDAQNGLSERVKKETERDLLLANQELQDLLPDFPWVLKIPKEYVISYRSANFKDFRMVEFKKLGSEEKISFTPVATNNGSALDTYLDDYIENLNKDSEYNWGVSRTTIISTEYGRGIRGSINSGGQSDEIVVIVNPNDSIVYVLDSNTMENPFFDYIVNNLRPQDTFKY